METIILFDPSIRSWNKGDEIIMQSAECALRKSGIITDEYLVKCGTHTPVIASYQNNRRNPHMKVYEDTKYKFICGSNLLWKNMLKPLPSLNVNLFNCDPYKNSILLGVGLGQVKDRTNVYTKKLYSKILSKEFIHSARDEKTERFLTELGYMALDTGCPTMWGFTPDFCKDIPKEKAKDVVFTLTDYSRNEMYDQKLINILTKMYDNVYFWIQGISDLEYFKCFDNIDSIKVIPPSLEAYSHILLNNEIDYVGTRLHAGMYALQHKKRTIMIIVDNRLRDMSESYKLNAVERTEIESLPSVINAHLASEIEIKVSNIRKWISQFNGNY